MALLVTFKLDVVSDGAFFFSDCSWFLLRLWLNQLFLMFLMILLRVFLGVVLVCALLVAWTIVLNDAPDEFVGFFGGLLLVCISLVALSVVLDDVSNDFVEGFFWGAPGLCFACGLNICFK